MSTARKISNPRKFKVSGTGSVSKPRANQYVDMNMEPLIDDLIRRHAVLDLARSQITASGLGFPLTKQHLWGIQKLKFDSQASRLGHVLNSDSTPHVLIADRASESFYHVTPGNWERLGVFALNGLCCSYVSGPNLLFFIHNEVKRTNLFYV